MKNNTDSIKAALINAGFMPLFYNANTDVCIDIVAALYKAGVTAVEFTNRGNHALINFIELKLWQQTFAPNLLLGAGTITNAKEAQEFIDAGASFLVSPGYSSQVDVVCRTNKCLYIPGCFTPSEMLALQEKGFALVKLFPGNVAGTAMLHAVKNLYPKLHFMVTGGVYPTAESIDMWRNAGASILGIGSQLIPAKITENDIPTIEHTASIVIQKIQALQQSKTIP